MKPMRENIQASESPTQIGLGSMQGFGVHVGSRVYVGFYRLGSPIGSGCVCKSASATLQAR